MDQPMTTAEKASRPAPKWVYTFGAGRADGSASDRNLLGGKGAYLAEMSRLGLAVPPGFTISAELCSVYYDLGEALPEELSRWWMLRSTRSAGLPARRLATVENPLLVSGEVGLARLDARHDGHGAQSRT
jgi:pyruvate,orthophosphate dikinase